MTTVNGTFEIILEKKGRGRGTFSLSRPWATRTFKLTGQCLQYFDNDKLKGTLDIKGGVCRLVPGAEADNKPFPFEVTLSDAAGKEKLMLCAPNESSRQKCIDVFTAAFNDPLWAQEKPKPVPVAVVTPPPQVDQAAVEAAAQKKADELQLQQKKLEEEQKRLEEEQKRLEEERLQQQAAAAAAVLREQAIKRELEQAAEAERKQQEEQQRQAIAMLKTLGAKSRFRSAREMGQMDIALDAAATMVQGAWKGKIAKRKVQARKEEKERLRKSAAARKIQTRYRCKMARRRVEAIKAEKLENKRQLAALKFQCAFRRRQARKILGVKRENRAAEEKRRREEEADRLRMMVERAQREQKASIRLQKVARGFIARRRCHRLRQEQWPAVIQVTVYSVEGLTVSGLPAHELGVVVSGLTIAGPLPGSVVDEVELLKSATSTSHDRSQNASSREAALAVAASKLDIIAVTLVDRLNGSKDTCVGQAFIHVADVRRQLHKGSAVDGTVTLKLPLQPLKYSIHDYSGRVQPSTAVTGMMTVRVRICDPLNSMCGWLWKVSDKLLGGNAWKKRWFILTDDGLLRYTNADLALEATKHSIVGSRITSITEESYKGRTATKIQYKNESNANAIWQLDFDEDAPPALKKMWQRRLRRFALAGSSSKKR